MSTTTDRRSDDWIIKKQHPAVLLFYGGFCCGFRLKGGKWGRGARRAPRHSRGLREAQQPPQAVGPAGQPGCANIEIGQEGLCNDLPEDQYQNHAGH